MFKAFTKWMGIALLIGTVIAVLMELDIGINLPWWAPIVAVPAGFVLILAIGITELFIKSSQGKNPWR